MNSWNQQQSPYAMATGMQFNARGPIYRADPIHGRQAAEQFPMGAGSEIYLPDADQDLIWWIRTDNYGNRMVKPFKVTPYEEPAPITLEDVMARLDSLEEKVNAKSNKSNAKRNAAAPTIDEPATAQS